MNAIFLLPKYKQPCVPVLVSGGEGGEEGARTITMKFGSTDKAGSLVLGGATCRVSWDGIITRAKWWKGLAGGHSSRDVSH